ncbi:TMEM14 family protein [Parachlamydia sp. AcF125]|uniref:TMEM14 family protein n=1 Tax=Parachlamydia sp. AcF125 TaxID=2795736 RepID=UPI001BC90F47|nr:TMEM14 family protein [Parachlamydia sp. AcF125]MBS4168274.1 hypothetical protein [Parachlamydia sp. AcF125]
MNIHASITWIYALFVLIGGMIGYVKAQSLASLVMAAGFAALLGFAGWLMWKSRREGYYLAIALIAFLGLFFLYRFSMSMKFMPAGLMVLLSLATGAAFAFLKERGE